jgi:hypothetical protein
MTSTDLPQKSYTPFCALLFVFLVFLGVNAAHVFYDLRQRSMISAAQAQLKEGTKQAQTINQTTEALGRDLVALSTNSPEAAKIISEFKIKINPSAPRPNQK